MTCDHITLPGGGSAIVCSSRRRQRCKCCGRPATLACDWKVARRRSGTCDAPLCRDCTRSPAPDKNLCPTHATAYEAWKAARS